MCGWVLLFNFILTVSQFYLGYLFTFHMIIGMVEFVATLVLFLFSILYL